jgi:hypothetical protein
MIVKGENDHNGETTILEHKRIPKIEYRYATQMTLASEAEGKIQAIYMCTI